MGWGGCARWRTTRGRENPGPGLARREGAGTGAGQSGANYYLQQATYKPDGSFAGGTVGLDAFNQWAETRDYNNRLQPRKVQIQKSGQTLLGLNWIYSASYDGNYQETGTDNNGTLRYEVLQYPSGGSPQTILRSYSYDGANRLSSYTEPGKYQYYLNDGFGNLWQSGAASGVPDLLIVLSDYLMGLQRPGQVVYWLREVLGVPGVTKEVLARRTNEYQRWVEAYARNRKIPLLWADKAARKEDYVRRYLRRMERAKEYGVYFIFQALEQGWKYRPSRRRVGKWHAGSRGSFEKRVDRLKPHPVERQW